MQPFGNTFLSICIALYALGWGASLALCVSPTTPPVICPNITTHLAEEVLVGVKIKI